MSDKWRFFAPLAWDKDQKKVRICTIEFPIAYAYGGTKLSLAVRGSLRKRWLFWFRKEFYAWFIIILFVEIHYKKNWNKQK